MTEFVLEYDNVEYPGYSVKLKDARAVVVFIHGIGEHYGKYDRLAKYMASSDISTYGIDLPGHGKSSGIRGQIGPRKYLHLIIDKLVEVVRAENPDIPLLLMGHSMGGNIALSYRLDRQNTKLTAFIVSSPWIKLVNKDTPFYRAIAKVASLLIPNYAMDNGIKSEDLYTPSDKVSPRNERDPLIHSLITPRTAADCFEWGKRVIDEADAPRRPVYLMHGSGDKICSVEGSRMFAKGCGSMCTYREWEGMQHELHNEARWGEVVDELIAWIKKTIK